MRILLIEDNKKVCQTLSFQLKKEGFTVDVSHNGEEGLLLIEENKHDLILLDRMLPKLDGIQILERMRNQEIHTPVILTTALGSLDDKVTGLETGADDYLVKPFDFPELLARIHSISRRAPEWKKDQKLSYGDISLIDGNSKLEGPSATCTLTKKESGLLKLFLTSPEKLMQREIILSHVWGANSFVEDGNIDNYIFLVRRKLKASGSRLVLKTVHGAGYRLEDPHV